jgi:hypothetical protein
MVKTSSGDIVYDGKEKILHKVGKERGIPQGRKQE